MKRYETRRWLGAAVVGMMVLMAAATGVAGDYVLVGNGAVGTAALSKADVKAMYLGQKTAWADGTPVVLTILELDVQKAFLKDCVGRTPSQLAIHWKKQVFAGKGTDLKTFSSEAALIQFLAATRGAIGFVTTAGAAGDLAGCKVITINE